MSSKETFNMSDLTTALISDGDNLVNALKKHVLESLSPLVRKRVEVLIELQGRHDELEAKFFEERAALEAALEAKYQKLYQSLYTKRYDIVNGVVEVDKSAVKGVPNFWLTALMNNEVTTEEISLRDEAALRFLKDIKWSKIENPKGFKLEFFFDTNPYFQNAVLTKTYHMIDENEPILEKAIGTEINWRPGMCMTWKVFNKKTTKGPKYGRKTITKSESFFNFFSPPKVPDDIEEDDAEELQKLMEHDYDIGSTIRDKIIPHAVSWFTRETAEDEFGNLEEEEDDDDDEEDEVEYEDEEEKPKRR